jgi:hypothetical protein
MLFHHAPSSFFDFAIFLTGSHSILPDLASGCDPPTCASQVAGLPAYTNISSKIYFLSKKFETKIKIDFEGSNQNTQKFHEKKCL